MKSSFYKPKKQGFYINGKTGYIEAMDIFSTNSFQIGNGLKLDGNDMFLTDFSIWWSTPITGDTTAIYFVNSDDAYPYNDQLSQFPRAIIQKRKSYHTTSSQANVLEITYDKRPIVSWSSPDYNRNYIFIGSHWDADLTQLDWFSCGTVQLMASDSIELGIFEWGLSSWQSFHSSVGIESYLYNYSYPAKDAINDNWSRIKFTCFETFDTWADAWNPGLTEWHWSWIMFSSYRSSYWTDINALFVLDSKCSWIWSSLYPMWNAVTNWVPFNLWASNYQFDSLYLRTWVIIWWTTFEKQQITYKDGNGNNVTKYFLCS